MAMLNKQMVTTVISCYISYIYHKPTVSHKSLFSNALPRFTTFVFWHQRKPMGIFSSCWISRILRVWSISASSRWCFGEACDAIENGPSIVDLPIENGGSFHSYVAVYQRVQQPKIVNPWDSSHVQVSPLLCTGAPTSLLPWMRRPGRWEFIKPSKKYGGFEGKSCTVLTVLLGRILHQWFIV